MTTVVPKRASCYVSLACRMDVRSLSKQKQESASNNFTDLMSEWLSKNGLL